MPDFLTFAQYAPLAAMGAVAVGERRDGWTRPARSAVLGLVAACLGLERVDEAAHASLQEGYGLALLVLSSGTIVSDYHTAQVPPQRRGRIRRTRAEELAERDLNTVLTRREYRQQALALVALWPRSAAPWTLGVIAEAMTRPRFTTYAGRKSCPFGLPLAARIAPAPDALEALRQRWRDGPEQQFVRMLRLNLDSQPAAAIEPGDCPETATVLRREWRRDAPASRARWQFTLREEGLVAITAAAEPS